MRTDPGGARAAGRVVAALALVLLAAPVTPARADAAAAGAALEEQALKVEEGLMCHCGCTDLTVKVCNCGVAAGIKTDIRERLAAGQTPDQVVDAYVAQYGAQIRSAPTRSGFDLLAWWMPFIAVFAAGAIIVSLMRRWARAHVPHAAAAKGAAPPGSAALDRVDRAVRDIL